MAQQDLAKQRPMQNNIKSRKKVWREPENPIRWAYAKLLKEHDETRRVYDVDPYAEVYQFRDNVYGILTDSLDGMGDPWIYLVLGPEKALLVDTGFGLGNLKGLVEQLAGGREIILVNTHAAYDHSFGNFPFGKAYCHEAELFKMQSKNNAQIWDYLFDENGVPIWCDFDRNDLVKWSDYEIVPVPNHTIFNLGEDYDIELIHLPGHSCGHAGFLDKKSRILIAGDIACFGALGISGALPGDPYARYGTVEALRDELREIVKRLDEFDSIFPGHGPVDTGNIVLVSALEACEAVTADPTCYDKKETIQRDGRAQTRYFKQIFESGYLIYTNETLYCDKTIPLET